MIDTKEEKQFLEFLGYHKKYGQRRGDSWNQWVLRKRSINTAYMVVNAISGYSFEDYELALYFRSDTPEIMRFLRAYEMQMEDAAIRPESFIANLDTFYMKMCLFIESNCLYRDFFDFCNLLGQERRLKIAGGHKKIFDAYISLVMQQAVYFSQHRMEESVSGITLSGELIFSKNPNPFSDLASYELEKYYPDILNEKKSLTSDMIFKAYQPYGYSIRDMESAEHLETSVRVYDNNIFFMIPYINEYTLDMQITKPYQHLNLSLPRIWKKTEIFQEMLQHRNYMLPATGITMEFINAADIWKIKFVEGVYNEQMVLLYHVFTRENGEFSGFFNTKTRIFYSIFEFTNRSDWHHNIENLILECYMILTCDYEIDRKKNFAIRQVSKFEGEFHFPYQPLAIISIEASAPKNGKPAKRKRNYDKRNYQEELRNRNGSIRNLPVGQRPSEEAQQYAKDMGYELAPGKTFVRPYQYRVHCKIMKSKPFDGP